MVSAKRKCAPTRPTGSAAPPSGFARGGLPLCHRTARDILITAPFGISFLGVGGEEIDPHSVGMVAFRCSGWVAAGWQGLTKCDLVAGKPSVPGRNLVG